MSPVIRISEDLYRRLGKHVVGFDTPAGVIERMIDFYESRNPDSETTVNAKKIADSLGPRQVYRGIEEARPDTRPASFIPRTYEAVATGRFTRDLNLGNSSYTITSPSGTSKAWELPDENDKPAIKKITHEVEEFVKEQGGTVGQIKAARKKLTEFGYHITK